MLELVDCWAGHCTVGTSDKVWAAGVAKTPDGPAAIMWCWGARDKTLQGKVMLFSDLPQAVREYESKIHEKQNQEEVYHAYHVIRAGLAAKLNSLLHQAQKALTREDCAYGVAIDQEGQTGASARTTKANFSQFQRNAPAPPSPRAQPAPPKPPPALTHQVDQVVQHASFGPGRVVEVTQSGPDEVVTVEFSRFGVKKLNARLAKLQVIEQ